MLVFTSAALKSALEIIGPVRAVLYVRSSLPCVDFVARLCRVTQQAVSENLCEGYVRLSTATEDTQRFPVSEQGIKRIEVDLWHIAFLFKQGDRVRLQVCSGAFPRLDRNTGHEAMFSNTAPRVCEVALYHDSTHPSCLVLPVRAGDGDEEPSL